MDNAMISVIVPVYNVEKYLPRCIDSILAQTFTDFELLLIDDGSEDNSGNICDEYAKTDDRIRVYHKNNGGVSSARNKGIESSNGKYLLFVDSDDYISNDYLSSFFREKIQEKTIIVQGCTVHRNNLVTFYKIPHQVFSKDKFAIAVSKNELFKHGSPYGKLFISSIIKNNNIKFDEHIHNYEDLLFFLEYIKNINSIVFIPDVGYHYNVYSGGLHEKINSLESELHLFDEYIIKSKDYWYINGVESNTKKYLWPLMIRCIKAACLQNGFSKNVLSSIYNHFSSYLYLPYYKCGHNEIIIAKLFKRKYYKAVFSFIRIYCFIRA